MSVLEDAELFGKTVGAARGSMDQPQDKKVHFAKLIGTSVPTLTRLEAGEIGAVGDLQKRREWARRIIDRSGCPPEWFGLSAPEPGEVDRLRREFEEELVAAKTELRAEAAKELEALEALLSKQGLDVPKGK